MIIKRQTKETVWYEDYFEFPDTFTVSDIKEGIDNGTFESYEGEYLLDTAENMKPEDNDGQSTEELYDEDGKMIYTNEEPKLDGAGFDHNGNNHYQPNKL
jgi:hypothetical protein